MGLRDTFHFDPLKYSEKQRARTDRELKKEHHKIIQTFTISGGAAGFCAASLPTTTGISAIPMIYAGRQAYVAVEKAMIIEEECEARGLEMPRERKRDIATGATVAGIGGPVAHAAVDLPGLGTVWDKVGGAIGAQAIGEGDGEDDGTKTSRMDEEGWEDATVFSPTGCFDENALRHDSRWASRLVIPPSTCDVAASCYSADDTQSISSQFTASTATLPTPSDLGGPSPCETDFAAWMAEAETHSKPTMWGATQSQVSLATSSSKNAVKAAHYRLSPMVAAALRKTKEASTAGANATMNASRSFVAKTTVLVEDARPRVKTALDSAKEVIEAHRITRNNGGIEEAAREKNEPVAAATNVGGDRDGRTQLFLVPTEVYYPPPPGPPPGYHQAYSSYAQPASYHP